MVKSIKFKVKDIESCPITKDVINEYKEYYNRCSDWIKNNLTSITIGEIAEFLYESTGKDVAYITMGLSDEWKDKPMYHLFAGKYHTKMLITYCITLLKQTNSMDMMVIY